MIRVSVLYPNAEGKKFDMAYYCERHIPMVKQRVGSACKGVTIDQGLSDGSPGSKPPYVAMAHLTFDSVDAFSASFGAHANEIMGDIPNYTDIQPVIQISEAKE